MEVSSSYMKSVLYLTLLEFANGCTACSTRLPNDNYYIFNSVINSSLIDYLSWTLALLPFCKRWMNELMFHINYNHFCLFIWSQRRCKSRPPEEPRRFYTKGVSKRIINEPQWWVCLCRASLLDSPTSSDLLIDMETFLSFSGWWVT